MNIDEARKRAQELGELAAADPDFRKRMESDPRGTMIEQGIPEALVDDILEPDFEGHIITSTMLCPYTSTCTTSACAPSGPTTSLSSTCKTTSGSYTKGTKCG